MSQQRRTYNQRQALSRYEERRRQEEARREMLSGVGKRSKRAGNWQRVPLICLFACWCCC